MEIWKNAAHGGGPWTQSIEGVHGPGPDKGFMDWGSMFCTFPIIYNTKTWIYKMKCFQGWCNRRLKPDGGRQLAKCVLKSH